MKYEILNRFYYLLTGVEANNDKNEHNIGHPGTGTISDCRVVMGWDLFQDKIPSSYYPLIVIEPGTTVELYSEQLKASVTVDVDIVVEVAGKLGALFGRGTKKGILEIERNLKAIILDKVNQKLPLSGTNYTSRIVSLTTDPTVTIDSTWIGKRFVSMKIEYLRIRGVGYDE